MTGEENKALIRRWTDCWNDREWESLYSLHDDSVIGHNPHPGQAAGLDGLIQSLGSISSALPDSRIEIIHILADGDVVADHVVLTGTHKGELFGIPPTGKPVKIAATNIWRITNGKIVEVWHLEDNLGLMQQIGAMPTVSLNQPEPRPAVRTRQVGDGEQMAAI